MQSIDDVYDQIAFRLRQRRIELGYLQREVADLAGISKWTVSKLETPRATNRVDLVCIFRVATVLGLELNISFSDKS